MNNRTAATAHQQVGDHTSDRDAHLRAVRRRMALAVLPPLPPEQLGEVQLLPHQRDAAARLLRILQWHHGALLADDVGLGKTFTALAVARRYPHVHVLSPAGLVAMWQAALLRTGQSQVQVHSLHRCSRETPVFVEHAAGDTQPMHRRPLVIIDEAHALRNAATARYRRLAVALAGCDVLLLSATPLHNSPRDLETLFALFRGHRTDVRREDTLASLIVRRDHRSALPHSPRMRRTAAAPIEAPTTRVVRPDIRQHRAVVVPQDRTTLSLLLALPAPLPAHDGAVAGALIRLGLLRAWCSSDAALTHALTRRLQRGSAMHDALCAGRHVTGAELRSWVIGEEHAREMQLGFPELLAEHVVPRDHDATRSLDDILQTHLRALRTLREHHATTAQADRVRAALLRRIRDRHPGVPVVAFSQFGRTVQALYRALCDIAGVGLLTGDEARIASGSITRPELLEQFAPRAHGRPPPPAHRAVSLLLATDLIAEGVNLQDAGVVVHLDLPWTDAVRKQRTGRVARLGSTFARVHEYRVRASRPVRLALRAEQRVARKAAWSARLVGGGTTGRSARRASSADVQSRWLAVCSEWATAAPSFDEPETDAVARARHTRAPRGAVVTTASTAPAAMVLLRGERENHVLAITRRGARWRVSARPRTLLALLDTPHHHPHTDLDPSAYTDMQRRVYRLANAWYRHWRIRHALGMSREMRGASVSSGGPTQQRALRWLHRLIGQCTLVQRQRLAPDIALARLCITRARGVAAEHALGVWMHTAGVPLAAQLAGWRDVPVLARIMVPTSERAYAEYDAGYLGEHHGEHHGVPDAGNDDTCHVEAYLLFMPPPLAPATPQNRRPTP
jgi:superfamily II DNA or RNA helicase